MFTKLEQHSWIKIEVARGRSTHDCFQGLREACGTAALLYRTVAQWIKAFWMPAYRTTLRGGQHSPNSLFPCWIVIADGLRVS